MAGADDRERLKGHLDLLLLSVLARGPAHGYAVIAALRSTSEGTFDLPEGTVYPALHRLERGGLLSGHWDRATDAPPAARGAGRRRKVYALTSSGEAALAAERTHWRRFRRGVGAVVQAQGRA
jgi:DNA-binding PadR family transcriptional regulator